MNVLASAAAETAEDDLHRLRGVGASFRQRSRSQ
jgi:hypothetical protein